MIDLHPEYIINGNSQKKAVVIPISEWEQIIEEMEELEDIRAYDAAKSTNEEEISFDQAIKEIKAGGIE